jgi:oligoendopeptidase F
MSIALLTMSFAFAPTWMNAQTSGAFDPFSSAGTSAYEFNLARNFYPSAAAAASARDGLVQRLRKLETASRRIDTAHDLYRILLEVDTLTKEIGRQYAYLSLRTSIDMRDAEAQRQLNDLSAVAEPILGEVNRTIGSITAQRLAEYRKSEPRLALYDYSIAAMRQDNARRLDPSAERVLAAVEGEATSWGPALFQTTLAGTSWGTVHASEGDLDVRRQGNQIRNHADRAVREAGFRLGQKGIEARSDTYAFILTREAAARNAIARQRGWPDYPTQAYAAGALTPDEIRGMLSSLAARSEVNKRYERTRIAEIKRDFGYDSVHVWDLTAPAPGKSAPRFTIEQATREVVDAAQPLGASYVRELRALLDPRNGRLDLIPHANRVDRAGFSTGSVGYPSMFFQGRFEGYAEDLTILAHEAGHGVQNMLMDSAGVLPRYAGGPSYFTESFAMLSELLLLEHLYRTSKTTDERQYYLHRLLDDAVDVFRNGHESLTELQLYDSVAAGRMLGPDGIETLTQSLGTRFSTWFGPGSERTYAWVQPLQFYTRPLYRVNYVIAKLLALRYMDMLHRDPVAFEKQYALMLRNGYDAEPRELLHRFVGIGLTDSSSLIDGAVRVMEQWLREADTR